MKVLRSSFVAAVAIFAAACGDKVNIVQPPTTTTSEVTAVAVAPTTAAMSIGQTVSFTAAVTATGTAATTVTWSSSDASKVSVSATGVATAVAATPGVAICATSTFNANAKGCASVTVSAAQQAIPASISIQSITATGNTATTVNPANVAGGIDVRLNVNPGNQTVSKIVLVIGSVRVDSQTFTAAQSASLRYAADQALAEQATFPQILFSVNTAFYTAATGTPRFLNGTQGVSAQLYTTAGGTAAAATATAQTNLTFNNVDGFHVTTTNPTGSAVDATGFRWTGNGSLVISARPVMYSGRTVGSVTALLSNVAGGTGCVAGTNTAALGAGVGTATATTATAGVWSNTLTFAAFSQNTLGCIGTTALWPTITATDAAGNAITLVTGGALNTVQNPGSFNADPTLAYRIDNVPPATPGLLAINGVNLNGRSNGWLNGGVVFNAFNAGTAATANNWQAVNVADAGVGLGVAGGGITYTVKVGQGTATAAATLASATGGTVATNASALAQTSLLAAGVAVQDCAIPYAADALGNTTLSPTGTCAAPTVPVGGAAPAAGLYAIQFGVDLAAPTASFSTSALASNMAANAGLTALTQMRVIATDTGLVGNSGFIGGTSVAGTTGSISRRTAAATSGTAVTVSAAAASNTNIALTRVDGSAVPVADTLVYDFSAITTNAYYTLTTVTVDQAGNPGPTLTRTVLKDNTVPTALAPVQNIVSPTAGGALTYNSQVADDLDLSNGSLSITFPAASFSGVLNVAGAVAAAPAIYAINAVGPITFNTYNVAPVVTSGTLSATLPSLYALQGMTDSTTIVASNSYPTAINAVVSDMANAAVVSAAGTVQNPPAAPALYTIAADYSKFLLARSGTTVNVAGSATVGAVFSRNITPRLEGTTAQAAPFTTVDLYVLGTGQTAYTFLGTSTLTAQTDNGGQRIWTYSAVAFAPSATFPQGANSATIIGIGKGAAGKFIMGQGTNLTVSP